MMESEFSIAPEPHEIFERTREEGRRRLGRSRLEISSTALVAGMDVVFGIIALATISAAFSKAIGEEPAHALGALGFGIAFIFIVVGRSELFTENFLVPVGAVWAGRSGLPQLLRMWAVTMVFNFAGLTLFAAIFAVSGVVTPQTLAAAGTMADTLGDRSSLAALMSAIAAGTIMTLFTWVVAAAETAGARVAASLVVGFVLAAPSLNHAIVGFGELTFGVIAGTAHSTLGDLFRIVGLAVAGNLIGGIGLVFTTRLAQVRAEPNSASGWRAEAPQRAAG